MTITEKDALAFEGATLLLGLGVCVQPDLWTASLAWAESTQAKLQHTGAKMTARALAGDYLLRLRNRVNSRK